MTVDQVREKYLNFFKERGHAIIPSSSLIPQDDPTTLFTGSGMQPLLPYLLGKEHPKGSRLVDSQRCFRAEDIEEVGDNRHTTFFEMLGNWSLGDYFKEDQLTWLWKFLTEELSIDPTRLYVTVFARDETYNIPKDRESATTWKRLFSEKGIEAREANIGSEADGYEKGMKDGERIFYYDGTKNWWNRGKASPATTPIGDPCGPDSEVFYDFGTEHDSNFGKHCHPNCDCGRFMEIGNSVFMEYIRTEKGFEQLPQKNVDFGGGLERLTAAANNDLDVFNIDVISNVIQHIEDWAGKKYNETEDDVKKSFRVVADHIRGAVFMISDGILPSNTEQGYLLRRLIRRAIFRSDKLGIEAEKLHEIVRVIVDSYKSVYPTLKEKEDEIANVILKEERAFRKTLVVGMKEFEKLSSGDISGKDAFILFSTYGFPFELTLELAEERGVSVDEKSFQEEMKKHQISSRAGAGQKFKGGLADNSIIVTKYHTATHLMLAGLRRELGDGVHQAGSNITNERTRFDFTHPEKVTRDILDKVEAYVNEAIQAHSTVTMEVMDKEDAKKDPAIEGSFWEKYPDEVSVYIVTGENGVVYSKELCGGPHVENTKGMGTFKITKEEASSAGVRRIKAMLED